MKVLAIDTSQKVCSVAVVEDGKTLKEMHTSSEKEHSQTLMPMIKDLLESLKITLDDINLLACSKGPGSFTGIRIGVSSIKPIAEVLNVKVASVTSLETLAKNVTDAQTIVSLIDARNNQVYCGIFDKNHELKENYIADDINAVIDVLKKYKNIICVGNGAILHKELLKQKIENIEFIENNEQSAKNVGKIGYRKFLADNLCTADTIVPIYLRKSQAERLKK